MALRRTLPFFVILLIFALTGCFQQAKDTFDTVDSSSGGNTQIINPTATEESAITIIAPGMDDFTPEGTATEIESASVEEVATDTQSIVEPTATNLPPPTSDTSNTGTIPTATTEASTFITPEVPVENALPTTSPTVAATRNPALQPTPTDQFAEEIVGDCVHIVQAGENAFRIALNNGVTLEDLLDANDLPPEPIIQPGQQLVIPGCDEGDSASTAVESTEEVSVAPEATQALEEGYQMHTVAPGETLLSIAQQYGVTVNEILAANPNLTNPNVISQGQELQIPPASR